ncbi:hypothetical protein HD554DRAFT_2074033 [Boletus coccyginus]|nr:hypothetical protein HD554DRAFT_2149070 [Boletus coccyginus]KAI9571780.1 hypothetical protein HD554DRAFT_2074033 [Boletus coccyginus]
MASTKPSFLLVPIFTYATKAQATKSRIWNGPTKNSASNLPMLSAKPIVSFGSTVDTSKSINANLCIPKVTYRLLRNVFSRS